MGQTFLTVQVTGRSSRVYPAGSRWLERFEDAVHAVAKRRRRVTAGTSSASESPPDVAHESFVLIVEDRGAVEAVADAVVAAVRRVGIRPGVTIRLSKREVGGDATFSRRVFATRDTRWTRDPSIRAAAPNAPAPADDASRFPKRIRYLAKLIARYYLVGGKDLFEVFPFDADARRFLSELPEPDARELGEAYRRIVANRDHEWIIDWGAAGECVTGDQFEAVYFLALLDRLREDGLLDDYGGGTESLVDWGKLAG